MEHVKKQLGLVRQHAIDQLSKVLKKFNPEKKDRARTNADVELLLATYPVLGKDDGFDKAREILHSLLTRLNNKEMDVIDQIFFQFKDQAETATILRIKQQTVSKRLNHALKKMRA